MALLSAARRMGSRLRLATTIFRAYVILKLFSFSKEKDPKVSAIIFSKDRPLQLHALLTSIKHHTKNLSACYVLFAATDQKYAYAYVELQKNFPNIHFTKESNFRGNLIKLIRSIDTSRLFFLVDDMLFTDIIDFSEILNVDLGRYILSLRLHPAVTYSYTANKEQTPPVLSPFQNGLLRFSWTNGAIDWSYPLSVDGHIFLRAEILFLIKNANFRAPNSLEASLQFFNAIVKKIKLGLCYHRAKVINFPVNKVQSEIGNLHGNMHQDELLKLWEQGYRMNIHAYYQASYNSVHVEEELKLIKNA